MRKNKEETFFYLDEKRRQKGLSILLDSTPARSNSTNFNTKSNETEVEQKEEEEVTKIKPSLYPLMAQVSSFDIIFIEKLFYFPCI